jgi:hypothetical protein
MTVLTLRAGAFVGPIHADPAEIRNSFELSDGIYVLGSFERGLTVYSQQARAHNLVWALRDEMQAPNGKKRIAVIGGGIAGLTVGAGFAASCPNAEIYLFERRAQLCPLQLGCDTRWLHPRIYEWPNKGSRAPSASLALLNWQAGRASDVAHSIIAAFNTGRDELTKSSPDPFRIFLGVEHITIDSRTREIEWTGRLTDRSSNATRAEGQRLTFDVVVVAAGFGVEAQDGNSVTPSYWRNESYGQPILDGMTHIYGISGFGDGALIDLARLTIDRFRQDRIIDEIFGNDDSKDDVLADEIGSIAKGDNFFDLLSRLEMSHLAGKMDLIRKRLRTDVKVGVYLGGKDGEHSFIRDVFGGKVSFINRVLLYFLFRCGAFVPIFSGFDAWMAANGVADDRRIVRHGTDVVRHLSRIFSNPTRIADRIRNLKDIQGQRPDPIYPLGSFSPIFGGYHGN